MSELLETTTGMNDLAIDQALRDLYRANAQAVEREAQELIASIKDQESAEIAQRWRVEKKAWADNIEAGVFGKVAKIFYAKWKNARAEIDGFTEPVKTWSPRVKEAIDRWYLAEKTKARILQEQKDAAARAEAEALRKQKVDELRKLGQKEAAKEALKRPLDYVPPTVPMPKIKHAVWKKRYIIQITDLPGVLRYIAKTPALHALIDQEKLIARLEGLAGELAGNMSSIDGVKCFQTEGSSMSGGPQ